MLKEKARKKREKPKPQTKIPIQIKMNNFHEKTTTLTSIKITIFNSWRFSACSKEFFLRFQHLCHKTTLKMLNISKSFESFLNKVYCLQL